MPAAQLTDEQLIARDTRDVSVGLSAGAGCGKTHVLTSRFLSHLDPTGANDADATELRQLIAITFTDAAAREMRSRIRGACYDRLDDPKLSDADHAAWQRLLREIDTARVSTIHAFCTALLRSNAAEAGLDPGFGVLEQSEADVLLQESLDDVLRERLEQHDADTLDLAAAFGKLSPLKERIVSLVDQRHRTAFNRWLVDRNDEQATAQEMFAIWKTCFDAEGLGIAVRRTLEHAPIADMQRLLAIATPAASNKKFPAAIATLTDILARLQQNPDGITDADLAELKENAKVQGLCKKDDWPTGDDFEAYKKACEKTRDAVKASRLPPLDDIAGLEAATLGLKLLRLASDVVVAYRNRKEQIAKLDFDDQLMLAHQLLSDPANSAVRESLSADLRLLLVDEFQDTDPLQVDLIKKICGAGFDEGRLFFVGDFKQSIYRFRGAVPPEFVKLRAEVPEPGRLHLADNFRSQPGVLEFVNALFHTSFREDKPLKPKRSSATAAPAVEFLWTTAPPGQARGKGTVEAARKQEATAIARRIRQLVDDTSTETPVVDKATKESRRLRPGDVAILFRALSDVRLYEEALREQGLEYYLVGGHAFYAQQEVFDVLNLLRAIASSADEVSLAGVLRSPFFALADESLFWLAESGGTLNDGLLAAALPAELSEEEHGKVAAAARTLSRLRATKNIVPVSALLNEALDLTGYDAVLLTEFLGERKLANLHKLVEHARKADENRSDLNEFIAQLTEYINQPPKEPLASTSAESADVVRLMTIHRAKGLEFPFVVVPDLDRPPRLDVANAALDDQLGPLVKLPQEEGAEESSTGMTLFAARERTEELEERKRLLYVACTRAADYLLLASSIESLDKPKGDWTKLIADHFDLETGAFHGELPADYELPRVHIAPLPDQAQKPVSQSRGPDLVRMLEDAHALATDGLGMIPPGIEPIRVNRSARRQFSFSRLTGNLVRTRTGSAAEAPSSVLETASAFDARSLGSLVHDVLARIDFSTAEASEIAAWCEHLAPLYVVHHADETARVASSLVERFVASPCGKRLAAANTLHREVEFLLPWPPEQSQSGRYFRGFIDVLYQDSAGTWRIVDYKTNEGSSKDVKRLSKAYEMQLYVYATAAEQSLGVAPAELVLELLRPGLEVVLPWNKTTRRRAIDLVNEAIEASFNEPPTPNA